MAALLLENVSAPLLQIRDQAINSLVRLIERFGIDDGFAYLEESVATGFTQREWLPHVSLGIASPKAGEEIEISSVKVELAGFTARGFPHLTEWATGWVVS